MAKDNKKAGIFARLFDYFKGVRAELKRVTWPTRQEVLNSCVIVVVTLLFFAAFTTVVDTGATELVTLWSKVGKPAAEAPVDLSTETTTTSEATDTAEEPVPGVEEPVLEIE